MQICNVVIRGRLRDFRTPVKKNHNKSHTKTVSKYQDCKTLWGLAGTEETNTVLYVQTDSKQSHQTTFNVISQQSVQGTKTDVFNMKPHIINIK